MIRAWQGGDREAFNQLFAILQPELRRMAHRHLQGQGPNCSRETGDLVDELYVKLVKAGRIEAECRGQFFKLAAEAIRCLLIDWARQRKAKRRGGDGTRVEMDEAELQADQRAAEVRALEEALVELKRVHPECEAVVVLRYFGGLTIRETADLLGVSPDTVVRRWSLARAWLARALSRGDGAAKDDAAAKPPGDEAAGDNGGGNDIDERAD